MGEDLSGGSYYGWERSSFLLAPVALATAKGGKQHKRWGMVYLWSMGIVAATALPMAFFFPVRFLALVAVFSFYFAFSAYRVLRLKELARGGSAEPIDWIAGVVTFAASALLAWLSWFRPASIEVIPLVGVVFGFIGMLGCGRADADRLCGSRRRRCSGGTRTWGTMIAKLYCGVVGVQRGDAGADAGEPLVCVAVADDGWGSGDCGDDGLLQAEVCAEA